jgi:hypothetical protein
LFSTLKLGVVSMRFITTPTLSLRVPVHVQVISTSVPR